MTTQPERTYHIEAEITFLPTESGGRQKPVRSGYRPNHDFGIPGMLNDAQHEYTDKESVSPGETVTARLQLHRPDLQRGRLFVGMRFTVQEGNRIVGNGKILRVCDKQLELIQ